jgi:hypothetical protein
MRTLPALLILLGCCLPVLARQNQRDMTAIDPPISPITPPLTAIKGDPRTMATRPPPSYSVMRSIQGPLDRSFGRIESLDLQLYLPDSTGVPRIFDLVMADRDRQMALDERRVRLDQLDERAKRIELDRREYYITVNAGISPMARQVEADRIALDAAKAERDRALIDASNALDRALRQPGADRAALNRQYEQSRREIRGAYDQARARILGDRPTP